MWRNKCKAWQCHFCQSWKGQTWNENTRRGDKQKIWLFDDDDDDDDDDKKDFPDDISVKIEEDFPNDNNDDVVIKQESDTEIDNAETIPYASPKREDDIDDR